MGRGSSVGGGGGGDFSICIERGEPKSQTPIMVLPTGVDIDEFMPEGREVVVVENILDPPRDEGEEELSIEKVDQFSW